MIWVVRVIAVSSSSYILRSRVIVARTALCDLLDKPLVEFVANYRLHHCEVLEVIVCLEQCVSREEFHEDAANAPYITWETPTKIENDLGCAVMSCGHDGRVILIIEGGRAKVDKPDFAVKQDPPLTSVSRVCV